MAAAAALAVIVETCAVSDIAQIPMLTAVVASETASTTRNAVVRISLKIPIMMICQDGSLHSSRSFRAGTPGKTGIIHAPELWREVGMKPAASPRHCGRQSLTSSGLSRSP